MIKIGETISKDFIPKDFPENSDLSQFRIRLFILDADENEYEVGNITEINAGYGEEYEILLTGNFDDGFRAVREE